MPDANIESSGLTAPLLPDDDSPSGTQRRQSIFGAPRRAAGAATNQETTEDLKRALPIATANNTKLFVSWIEKWASQPKEKADSPVSPASVGFFALLSFSTAKEKWLMLAGIILAAVSALSLPAWLYLLAKALDKLSGISAIISTLLDGGGDALMAMLNKELIKLVIGFAVIGVISMVTGTLYISIWTYTGERQALRIKELFVRSAFHQDAEWFDHHNPEELPTKIANAMGHISNALGRQIAETFANAWAGFGCIFVSLWLNAPLAIVMLCVIPIIAIIYGIISIFIRKSSKKSAVGFSTAGAIATEAISGIRTIASLCAEEWTIGNYNMHSKIAQRASVYTGFLGGLAAGITGFLFYITITFAFLIGTYQVSENPFDLQCMINCFFNPRCKDIVEKCPYISGAAVMCCIYGVILSAAFFGMTAPGLNAINLARQAAVDIYDTIKREPAIKVDPSEDGLELDNLEGAIEFKDILFAYPSRPKNIIFRDVSLMIEPGSSVGLVGPSGSGKSTFAKLLLRFYDPLFGDVLVDDVPLKQLNLHWWRSQVGYVAQEPTLFPGTIRENIAFGKPDATEDEIVSAAKAACAHEFITDLPDGYDTFNSGASIQLSGGQMQRICIARAIIKNPILLLLDEATSALDSNSEKVVQDALENIRKHKKITTISVAHRLSTIMRSDQIAVINNGVVAELGNHQTLLQEGGIYATLCESQGIFLDSSAEDTSEVPQDAQSDLEPGGKEQFVEESIVTKPGPVKHDDPEDPTDLEEGQIKQKTPALSRLWKLNRAEWGYIAMGICGAAVVGTLSPSEAIFTAQIVENYYVVKSDELWSENLGLTAGFLLLAILSLFGNVALACGFSVSGFRLTRKIKAQAFEAIVRHGMGWFDYPEHSTGELTTRLEEDCEAVAKVTGWSLGYKVRVICSLTAGVIISLCYSWQVGLVAVGCIPIIMSAAIIQANCVKPRVLKIEGISPATILESGLRGITSIHAYNLQDKFCVDYSVALEPYSAGKTKEGMMAGLVFGLSQCAIFCSFALLFYVGVDLLMQIKIGFADFFTALLSVMFGALASAQVGADFNSRQEGAAAAERIFDIIDDDVGSDDPFGEDGEKPSTLDGSITFDSCSFHYPTRPNHPIYYPANGKDGFSLSIAPKESVAFVGKSGCGKSTALQLVLRFYNASAGKVLVDNKDIQSLNLRWLRQNIGYVGQMPILFSGTVRSNIILGNGRASEEEVIAAAKAANAHDFIMSFEDGYNTDIGTGGSLLSGGQKQRIAIARAIVKNPKILVLDEATAALDNESERIVQKALDNLQETQPRTTLVVAHRLVTVKNCDKIAVLGEGGVKELGDHSSLLEQNGLYNELWRKQGATSDS